MLSVLDETYGGGDFLILLARMDLEMDEKLIKELFANSLLVAHAQLPKHQKVRVSNAWPDLTQNSATLTLRSYL